MERVSALQDYSLSVSCPVLYSVLRIPLAFGKHYILQDCKSSVHFAAKWIGADLQLCLLIQNSFIEQWSVVSWLFFILRFGKTYSRYIHWSRSIEWKTRTVLPKVFLCATGRARKSLVNTVHVISYLFLKILTSVNKFIFWIPNWTGIARAHAQSKGLPIHAFSTCFDRSVSES